MRETVEIVRRGVKGERVTYKGHVYELPLPGGEGKALRSSASPRPDIPIYLATLSPRSLEMTGEIADGWLGTSFMPEHARVFFDAIEAGAKRAGRSLAQLDLQAGGHVAFGDDVERLLAARKPGLAFTLGAMGSRQHNFYNDAFKRAGYVDAAVEVQRLWLDGKRDEAAARVPDEMAVKVNLLGTEAMVRERVATYRGAGITTLRVDPGGATLDARLATLGRLMELVEQRAEGCPRSRSRHRIDRRRQAVTRLDHLGRVQTEILAVPRADDLHPERNPRRVAHGHRHRRQAQQVHGDQ